MEMMRKAYFNMRTDYFKKGRNHEIHYIGVFLKDSKAITN